MSLKIFETKPKDSQITQIQNPLNGETHQASETYKQYGFRMAGIAQGALQSFTPNLQSVYLGLKKEQEEDKNLQEELKKSLQTKLAIFQRDKSIAENNLTDNAERQKVLDNELEDRKGLLVELKTRRTEKDRNAWISLMISGIILIPFTLYFFIFYSSVAYSAFFKNFTPDHLGDNGDFNLAAAIFDAQAISTAALQSITTLLFILLMPVIFLAFGFVLNRWERENGWLKWLKIPLLICVAFIFDTLLSYEICEKIYNLDSMMSFEEKVSFSLSLAIKEPQFWVIICLGFVSYLIWGLTFGFFIKALEQLDFNKIREEQLKTEIQQIKDQKATLRTEKTEISNKIASIEADIHTTENQLNGTVARYDINKIKLEMNNFLAGWQQYMSAMGKTEAEKNVISTEFEKIVTTFVTI